MRFFYYIALLLRPFQLPFESAQLLFLGGLMPTAWKRFTAMLAQFLAPLMDRRVGYAQFASHLGNWFSAGLGQLDGLALKFRRRGLLDFLHPQDAQRDDSKQTV